jgi:hypothetical protein
LRGQVRACHAAIPVNQFDHFFVAVCAVGVVESVTLAVNVNEPDAVGVPEIVPAVDSQTRRQGPRADGPKKLAGLFFD